MAADGAALSYKVIGHLGKLLGKNTSANKSELKELDKDLALLSQQDADALVEAGTLELLLRYLPVEVHFEVVTKCLNTMSVFDSARHGLYDMNEGGMSWLAEYTLNAAKTAKTEKQIDRAAVLAKILVLYSIDAPDSLLTWLTDLSQLLAGSLERTQANARNGQQEAYTYLSVMLPSMWVSMGSSLAPTIAANIINAGGMPLLLNTARDVQRVDLKGLPKIIAEKALNLLCACNAEQPALSLEQVEPHQVATFCIETATRSDWVQSQELSVVLLGRLVFLQGALPLSYMATDGVLHMLQHCMTTKSPALRCTAFCLSCICPEAVFDAVCVEASAAMTDLGEGTYQSIKRLAAPTAGGMTILRWGHPINRFAKDVLRNSKLLSRMADAVPVHLPSQLVELLSGDLRQYVIGVKAANGVKDEQLEAAAEEGQGDDGYADAAEPAPFADQDVGQPLEDGLEMHAPVDEAAYGADVGNGPSGALAPHASTSSGAAAAAAAAAQQGVQGPPTYLPIAAVARPSLAGTLRGAPAVSRSAVRQLEAQPEERVQRHLPGSMPMKRNRRTPPESEVEASKKQKIAAKSVQPHQLQLLAQTQAKMAAQLQGAGSRPGTSQPTLSGGAAGVGRAAGGSGAGSAGAAGAAGREPGVVKHTAAALMAAAGRGDASKAVAGGAQQPLATIRMAPQPQAPGQHRSASGGGEPSVGSVENNATAVAPSKAFTGNDMSQLNNFLYELTMESSGLDDKAKQVLNNLLQGASLVPNMLNMKHRLPAPAAAEYDNTLRQWSTRVRQMGASLSDSKGPALDMMVQFSNMMLDEITCCSNDMQRQVKELAKS